MVPSEGLGIDGIPKRAVDVGFQQLTFWGCFGLIECRQNGQSP